MTDGDREKLWSGWHSMPGRDRGEIVFFKRTCEGEGRGRAKNFCLKHWLHLFAFALIIINVYKTPQRTSTDVNIELCNIMSKLLSQRKKEKGSTAAR